VGWAASTIGEIADQAIEQAGPNGGGAFLYVDISSIDRGIKRIVDAKVLPVESAPSRARQRLQPGDVLVSMTRPNLNAVAILPAEMKGAIGSTGFFVLRSHHVTAKWLFFLVQTTRFVDAMSNLVLGVLYPAVRPKDIASHTLFLPPSREQNRIVAEIEKQFTRLDAAVAALGRVQANLKRYRAAVLKAACEGRLVPTEAELARKEGRSYETGEQLLARILKERRTKWEAGQLAKMVAGAKPSKNDDWKRKYTEPKPPDMRALPRLPDGWIWVSLDQIICAGPQNGLYKAASAYGTGTPILRIDDYQIGSCKPREDLKCLRTSGDEEALYALAPGDIILNRVNSPSHLGKCTVVAAKLCPCVFESNMMRFRTSELIDPEWVTTVLQTVDGKARLTANAKWAVNQASINQQDIKQTAVPLPPTAEKAQILAAVRQQLSINLKLGEELDTTSRHAERLRQSILKHAFEGKLVAQDLDDEPASVLLERIRVERVTHRLTHRDKKLKTGLTKTI
jgi:type I restriction enzyme S subunit